MAETLQNHPYGRPHATPDERLAPTLEAHQGQPDHDPAAPARTGQTASSHPAPTRL